MYQIPSLDWPRRTTPLTGLEDILKQNPIGDTSPQEERVPVSLISNFTISQIALTNVGTGIGVVDGKFVNDFRFRSIKAKTPRIEVSLLSSTIEIDANPLQIANSIQLFQIGDVTNTPNVGGYLQWNGSSWVTNNVINEILLTDTINTEIVDGTNKTITFQPTVNIIPSVNSTNSISFDWTANLTDLTDVPNPTNANQVLKWNGTTYIWEDLSTVIGGAVTNGQNVGSLGFGTFVTKNGSILQFRNVAANSSKISVSLNSQNIRIDAVPLQIAGEIKLIDLQDVNGTVNHGDTIIFNDTVNQWIPTPATNISLKVKDESNVTNTFNAVTDLKITGNNTILTTFINSTDLEIRLTAGLQDLTNVQIGSPSNGQGLFYNSVTTKWENQDVKFTLLGNSGSQVINNGESLKILGQNGIAVQVISPDTALVKLDASITDLNDINPPSNSNTILYFNGTNYVWESVANINGGSLTASNVGTLGYGVFKQKTGTNLEFKNVATNSSKIAIIQDINNNIRVDAVPLEIADEIRLQDLLDVTNLPSTNGYLKFNGTEWITDVLSTNFSFNIEADTGINITIEDNDTYILSGDDTFIYTVNTVSGSTNQTAVSLNINAVANAIDLEDLHNVFGNPATNDILIYDGMNFIFQPLPTQAFSNAWLLDGNNETSEKFFGTLSNFSIPIVVNNIQVGVFKNTGKFGWGVSNPQSTIEVNGSSGIGNCINVSANYTMTDTDYMVAVNASSGPITITLPSATGIYRREYIVKKIDGSSNPVNIVSVSNIDATTTYPIVSQWVSIKLKSNNTQWLVF